LTIIYDKDECPFCYRVRLCLGAAGVPYERRAHDDPNFEAQWQGLTHTQTVPVFVHRDLVLTDSAIILEYLEDRYGGLLPSDPVQRARAREWLRYADVPVGRSLREVVFERRERPQAEWDEDRIDRGIRGYLQALPDLDAWLADCPFFGGDAFSLADAALTARFALGMAYGVDIPASLSRLRRYFEARLRDPFFVPASPQRVMARLRDGSGTLSN
jgi:glutathione S-transferase